MLLLWKLAAQTVSSPAILQATTPTVSFILDRLQSHSFASTSSSSSSGGDHAGSDASHLGTSPSQQQEADIYPEMPVQQRLVDQVRHTGLGPPGPGSLAHILAL